MTGPAAAAKLRGTDVMLAAAGRSCGGTMAMTYDVRVGTSFCDNALRASRHAIAQPSVGMNGTRIRNTLDGRCVNTIVFTKPIRRAIRTATRYENEASTPAQKKMVPATAVESWNLSKSHSTTIESSTRPPAKESRLKSAASL